MLTREILDSWYVEWENFTPSGNEGEEILDKPEWEDYLVDRINEFFVTQG